MIAHFLNSRCKGFDLFVLLLSGYFPSFIAAGGTGDFAGIAPGTQATMAQPWIFNPSRPTPGLWSVGGFAFDLLFLDRRYSDYDFASCHGSRNYIR